MKVSILGMKEVHLFQEPDAGFFYWVKVNSRMLALCLNGKMPLHGSPFLTTGRMAPVACRFQPDNFGLFTPGKVIMPSWKSQVFRVGILALLLPSIIVIWAMEIAILAGRELL